MPAMDFTARVIVPTLLTAVCQFSLRAIPTGVIRSTTGIRSGQLLARNAGIWWSLSMHTRKSVDSSSEWFSLTCLPGQAAATGTLHTLTPLRKSGGAKSHSRYCMQQLLQNTSQHWKLRSNGARTPIPHWPTTSGCRVHGESFAAANGPSMSWTELDRVPHPLPVLWAPEVGWDPRKQVVMAISRIASIAVEGLELCVQHVLLRLVWDHNLWSLHRWPCLPVSALRRSKTLSREQEACHGTPQAEHLWKHLNPRFGSLGVSPP